MADAKEKPPIEKIAEELKVELPQGPSTILRIIELFTLIGGLSILGSVFADIVRPGEFGLGFFINRVVMGSLAVYIAYGLIIRQRWAIWLYGFLTILSLLTNPVLAILPAAILFYLYTKRQIYQPSIFDEITLSTAAYLRKLLGIKEG